VAIRKWVTSGPLSLRERVRVRGFGSRVSTSFFAALRSLRQLPLTPTLSRRERESFRTASYTTNVLCSGKMATPSTAHSEKSPYERKREAYLDEKK
jgi:hypothetical protein